MIAYCPICKKPRTLIYYDNVKGYQCICCGSIIKNPKPIKQQTLIQNTSQETKNDYLSPHNSQEKKDT